MGEWPRFSGRFPQGRDRDMAWLAPQPRLHPCTAPPGPGSRSFWLPEELSRKEADSFRTALIAAAPNREPELLALKSEMGRDCSAFYFGLTAFGRDFAGIQSYVCSRLHGISPEVK